MKKTVWGRLFSGIVAQSVLLLLAVSANADVFYLTKNNIGLDNGVKFATVTLTQLSSTSVGFNVFFDESLFKSPGGIQSFAFNTDLPLVSAVKPKGNKPGSPANFSIVFPGGNGYPWNVKIDLTGGSGGFGPFGKFEIDTSTCGNGNRHNPLSFIFNYSGGLTPADLEVLNQNGYKFAAHFAGFAIDNSCVTSGMFGDGTPTTVPEPGTMMLLGSGLVGLAGYGRKRFLK